MKNNRAEVDLSQQLVRNLYNVRLMHSRKEGADWWSHPGRQER